MAGLQRTVVLVHGIFSNGAWHALVRRVLWPFFDCQSIRYREYHAFGPINLFFWPWALLLGGLLGWLTLRRAGGGWEGNVFLALLLVAALVEAYRSGFARALPWLLTGGFCLGGLADLWTLAALIIAGLLTVAAAYLATEKERRSLSVGLLGLLAATACWGAGWLFARVGEGWLLRTCVLVAALYLQLCERDWKGKQRQAFWPLLLGAGGLFLSWLASEPVANFFPWAALLLLMAGLEWEECWESGQWVAPSWWPALVLGLVFTGLTGWKMMDRSPEAGYLLAALVLVVGWLEPTWRARRAAQRVLTAVEPLVDQLARPPSWIAHSLGTFLSGETFRELDFDLDRVVFVGGAISEAYDWSHYVVEPYPRLTDVRNEHGSWDMVIRLLWHSGAWARRHGLGGAGWVGLRPPGQTRFHRVDNHRVSCTECHGPGGAARVHNYPLDRFRHSTYFLREQHARDFWLPYLWGHAPDQVRGFLTGCSELFAACGGRGVDRVLYDTERENFQASAYNWYLRPGGEQAFGAYVRDEVGEQMDLLDQLYPGQATPPSRQVVEEAAVVACQLVAAAVLERRQQAGRQERILEVLNPPVAIGRAAQLACERVAHRLRTAGDPS